MKEYEREKYTPPSKEEISDGDLFLQEIPKWAEKRLPDWCLYEKMPEWLRNFRVNRDTIGFDKTIRDLPKIDGSAIVVDKSFASTMFYEQVHHLSEYRGTIIVCDRALAYVLRHRVPDIVCQLDSHPICQYFFDLPEVKKHMKEINAVFATTTHPLTIRLWNGPRYFFQPWMGDWITWNLMSIGGVPLLPTGGQVACFAWILAMNLGAKHIGVFGVTNGYDDMAETEYPGVEHRQVEGPHGTCYQDPVYGHYNDIYLAYIKYAKEKHGIDTFNLMKAGLLYSDFVKDLSLEEFVRRFSK